ncbi:DUF4440 domain-containing protein [Sphingomonas sp. ABOLD]|jgi:uncharacterized protein (TIGR02246 family)|uniref:DUF4440 domain-containing protein n=1 Tax=Sphingomonas turrisvirgatae TaxID=1888892 RepID=A0A1E3LSN6_9SPHN|nr:MULTISPECIES: nuclear transport factor 2 family protein [Sphingomonas]OYX47978.1 MAG: DUF4440 domain-containing protein [Sphingomonas sp. 32-66-10]KKC24091.1 hypothetical protein WP12_21200 [Sphingomonas sp. SRS2]MCM3681715.1 nuclear transport factor 2 family protein [Sphingomonas paucimobilis]ODP36776.1 DUF4440 domain-containing protein [Sphingomonas turrisvirgatae]RSV51593.1 DUF4440 domain-containing protein [Sphingomonas sp. ABOLD]
MSTCVKMIIAVSIALPAAAWAQSDARTTDTRAVAAALSQYKDAIEKLDAAGTEQLFTTDARVFETGASEGSYATYLAHHLGPELKQFKSFRFSDYKVDVRFEGSVALATETYRYRIEPKTGEAAERLGVATSVLKKMNGRWKIVSMHNSARKLKGT